MDNELKILLNNLLDFAQKYEDTTSPLLGMDFAYEHGWIKYEEIKKAEEAADKYEKKFNALLARLKKNYDADLKFLFDEVGKRIEDIKRQKNKIYDIYLLKTALSVVLEKSHNRSLIWAYNTFLDFAEKEKFI